MSVRPRDDCETVTNYAACITARKTGLRSRVEHNLPQEEFDRVILPNHPVEPLHAGTKVVAMQAI